LKRSALRNPIDEARGVKEGGDLVHQLLDVERDFHSLLDVAGVGAGLRGPANARGFVEPLTQLRQVSLDGDFNDVGSPSREFLRVVLRANRRKLSARAHHASHLLQLRVPPRSLQARLLSTQGTCEGIMTIQDENHPVRGVMRSRVCKNTHDIPGS
jgi:hypothetical protein